MRVPQGLAFYTISSPETIDQARNGLYLEKGPVVSSLLTQGACASLSLPPPVRTTVWPASNADAGADSTASRRRSDIAASRKPRMHVIDLVDNCGKHKVMSMSTALGLSSGFRGDDAGTDGMGGAFSVEYVGSLASEAMSLVDADGAAEVENACSHPLLEAKTPRELALLVKHYRLLQGAKTAETTLTVTGRGAHDGISSPGWDLSQLSVGDRIGKDSFLRVVVQAILSGNNEGEDDDESEDFDDEDVNYDDTDHDCDDYDDEDGYERSFIKPHQRTKRRRFPRAHIRTRPSPRWRKKKRFAAGSATVRMRHASSGTIFSWRTSGVKDTSGAELHEGASYRLVATVADAWVAGGAEEVGVIGVTRCRLTLVTADASGGRR